MSKPALADEDQDSADGDEKGAEDDVEVHLGLVLAGEGYVHAVERGDDDGDGEDDGQRGEELDGSVDVVGEEDLIGVAQRADALDADAAEVF